MEIRRAFHEELDHLRSHVTHLAGLASEAVEAATTALLAVDLALAQHVLDQSDVADGLTISIESEVSSVLARQQPMATDLRDLLGVLWLVRDLERICANAANIAKAAARPSARGLHPSVRGILDRMRTQGLAQLAAVTDAFVDRDDDKAATLDRMDDAMDDLQAELIRTVIRVGAIDGDTEHAVEVTLLGRYFERIADLCVDMAARVHFMATGDVGAVRR